MLKSLFVCWSDDLIIWASFCFNSTPQVHKQQNQDGRTCQLYHGKYFGNMKFVVIHFMQIVHWLQTYKIIQKVWNQCEYVTHAVISANMKDAYAISLNLNETLAFPFCFPWSPHWPKFSRLMNHRTCCCFMHQSYYLTERQYFCILSDIRFAFNSSIADFSCYLDHWFPNYGHQYILFIDWLRQAASSQSCRSCA